jgi:hypothetical protein
MWTRCGLVSEALYTFPIAAEDWVDLSEISLIDEMANLLGTSVNQMRSLREANGYAALRESPLITQLVREKRTADLFSAIALLGYETAAAQIAAAEDHMLGMATLLAGGQSMVAPFVLARSAIEASARASYIVDPNSPPRSELRASSVNVSKNLINGGG